MSADKRFRALLSDYFASELSYEENRDHFEEAQVILTSVAEIETVHNELQADYDDDRHWFQQQFITKSLNGILSSFLSTRNQFYDSAYRDVRSLFEAFLLLNYMNENKIETAKVFHKQERDLLEMDLPDGKLSWTELHSEDKLHDMIRKERKRLEDLEGDYGQLYNYLSNARVHPTRTDGVALDRQYVAEEERQLFHWQLDLTLGLILQLLKLYSDTPAFSRIKDLFVPVIENIVEELGHEHQPFLDIALEKFPLSDN